MAKIQIFSVIGKNGIIFSQFLRKNMIRLSSGQHELDFNCFMSSRELPPEGWNGLGYVLKQRHTSLNHTTGLNMVSDHIDGDFIICADVDVAMLCPNWDKKMIDHINADNLDILGVSYWTNDRGYENFPSVTFFMAKSYSHLQACPDMRPNLVKYPNKWGCGAKVIQITTDKEEYIFNKSKGSCFLQDSGWQLPYSYKLAGLRSDVFTPNRKLKIDQVPQIWSLNNENIICHKGKSSKRRQSIVFKFIKSVTQFIEKTHNIRISE